MVLNATFNNISVISWGSALLVEETRVPRENHLPAASHWVHLAWAGYLSCSAYFTLQEDKNKNTCLDLYLLISIQFPYDNIYLCYTIKS